jgi:hypothetical protein
MPAAYTAIPLKTAKNLFGAQRSLSLNHLRQKKSENWQNVRKLG